jgi:hypothetical protein
VAEGKMSATKRIQTQPPDALSDTSDSNDPPNSPLRSTDSNSEINAISNATGVPRSCIKRLPPNVRHAIAAVIVAVFIVGIVIGIVQKIKGL